MPWRRVPYVRDPTIAAWRNDEGVELSIQKFSSKEFFEEQHEVGEPRYVYMVELNGGPTRGGGAVPDKHGSDVIEAAGGKGRKEAFKVAAKYRRTHP